MVETIAPVVHGGKRNGYRLSVAMHALGAAVTGAAFGAALGLAGSVIGAPWGGLGVLALAAVAGVYFIREAAGVPIPVPERRRQVPDWWRTFFSPPVAALLYGGGLGVGFLTFLSFATYVAVATAPLLLGDPVLGATVCGTFGLARGLVLLLGRRSDDAAATAALVDRLEDVAGTRYPRLTNAAALAAVALAAASAAL